MEEPSEECEIVCDVRESIKKASKGLGLSSQTETLVREDEDANAVDVSDSGVCDGIPTDDSNRVDQVSDDNQAEADAASVEDTGDETNYNVDKVQSSLDGEGEDSSDSEQNVQTETSQQSSVDGEDKHSESAKIIEESTEFSQEKMDEGNSGTVSEVSSAAEICHGEEITNVNQKEENGEAIEVDYATGEHVENDVKVGGGLDSAADKSAGASVVPTQQVPLAEADGNDSSVVKEMETDDRRNNVGLATDLSQTIESADSDNSNSPSEDAATGEVEPLDHNALFDPSSDITHFIDFSGVSSWSGNIQNLKTETGNVSLHEDKMDVATVDCKRTLESVDATVNAEGIQNEPSETCVSFGAESPAECPREVSEAIMGSEEDQEDKDHEGLDMIRVYQQDAMREEDGITHEAPSIDPNQNDDALMEENPKISDYADNGTYSDIKTNGVKRKADVLNEDSLPNVSFTQTPSFKIGTGIARAASQMAGYNSVLKDSNFGNETLSVETFVAQLDCEATDPVKEDVVSDLPTGFFLDSRDSNVEGTEAFEFEEMGDTYWTDRVIHNGGEEQPPPTENGNYQIVPVELKPAQIPRTRRPYRRRQSQINAPLQASVKPANFDENAPAELIMKFSESDTIPPEKSLSKMFRYFGPIRESQTEVDKENNRARIVYRKGSDAEVAYNSAGIFSIFGTKAVNYELNYTITETFKVKPDVAYLGEENATLHLPS